MDVSSSDEVDSDASPPSRNNKRPAKSQQPASGSHSSQPVANDNSKLVDECIQFLLVGHQKLLPIKRAGKLMIAA